MKPLSLLQISIPKSSVNGFLTSSGLPFVYMVRLRGLNGDFFAIVPKAYFNLSDPKMPECLL